MNRSELEELYDEHADALFCFLLSVTRSEEDSRDLMQELFARLAQRGTKALRGVGNRRSYLFKSAYHLAVDQGRRRKSRRKALNGMADATDASPASPFARAADPDRELLVGRVEEALSGLPEEQRTAVHLKLWAGLTFSEIAGVCGVSPNTAASRYRYGIDKMRRQLRPVYEELKDC